MKYSIHQLAALAGISTRTLRFYEAKGLLSPQRSQNKYRVYSTFDVDALQQIMLYRELGMSLTAISNIMRDPHFDPSATLKLHLAELTDRKSRIEKLISNVQQTIANRQGENTMSDAEKFNGFKKELIIDNNVKYDNEVTSRYDSSWILGSQAKLLDLNEIQYNELQTLTNRILSELGEALSNGNPSSSSAQQVCALHQQWLQILWPSGTYSTTAHLGLSEVYLADDRFVDYYDQVGSGATNFLCAALKIYCNR